MSATEAMIYRLDQIEKLISSGVRTVAGMSAAMNLSPSSVRRYLDMMLEDEEIHIGEWEGDGRYSRAMYSLGKSNKVVPPKRQSWQKKKEPAKMPVVRDPMLTFLFGEYRRAA